MHNFVEKYLCVEILEKIARMKRYLRLEPSTLRTQNAEIISIFFKALDGIVLNLAPIVTQLSIKAELNEWEKVAIIRRLSDIFNSLDELHAQLQLIYGTWVRPETHVFLKNVLEFIPERRRPKKVSVILSNTYSFEESDLSTYFEYVLSTTNVSVNFGTESPTVFLPKIECENPLNWAILAHECGHIDIEGINNIFQNPDLIQNQNDPHLRKILHNWAEEIYCDLLATKILGPAYFASFATVALLLAGSVSGESASKTHPADIVRMCIIYEVLEKNGMKIGLDIPGIEQNDLASFYYILFEDRTKLDRKYIHHHLKQPQPNLQLQEFVDVICEQVDTLISLSRQLTLTDFTRVKALSERLSRGIIIGSYHNLNPPSGFSIDSLKRGIDRDLLNTAKEATQEKRTLLWEIINAGWLHKIEYLLPRSIEIFFSQDGSLEKKIKEWGEVIEVTDRLLLKSIESSEVFRIMEED